ncbi:MAG: YebC/PmpR family DNA-binding transcriptional regulator [Deltaproteobacteria bacterium]|nr:YebC/PmpR family DNA-binding transcriptional regulator [Deltaproteobacteria bacterium]
MAFLVNYMTDNKNRTASDVRHAFTSSVGSLGQSGSVAWMFEKKGCFTFAMASITEDKLMEAALDAGATDVKPNADEGVFEVYAEPAEFHKVKSSFDGKRLLCLHSEITMIPKTTVRVEGKAAQQVLRLMEELEDLDDVQTVYANFDMPSEEMAKIA